MKRIAALLAVGAALVAPATAIAHPLGNFTVNRFSRLQVAGDRLYVRYVLDLAEIPTFQAGAIDAGRYARKIATGLDLGVDGRPARLFPVTHRLTRPVGAGGLPTTRLELVLAGPRLPGRISVAYHDNNYAGRIGWKEVVVGDAPSPSHELRAYPKDLLRSPLDVTSVTTRLAPGDGPSVAPPLSSGPSLRAPDRIADSGFAALVGREQLSLLVILGSLGVALFWGAAHALSPGHGKAIVTAYLVGRRGTAADALVLGLTVTATHTAGVFALGLATLLLSSVLVPEDVYPWLNLASGMFVVGIGVAVLAARVRHRRAHSHGHDHRHHDHSQSADRPGLRSLLAVGASAGLLPCPSALVVLLGAISLHRVGFGLLLVVAFSAGLAVTITAIGLTAVAAKRAFARVRFESRLIALLPAASALVIVLAGLAMTARALPRVV